MLQRIEPHSAELGMFIERLEGNWLTHPFWRKRFVISDADQLAALQTSAVTGVIIDTSRGASPTPAVERKRTFGAAPRAEIAPRQQAVAALKTELPGARHFGNARRVAQQSGKIVSQIFLKARLGQAVSLQDVEPVLDEIYNSVAQNPFTLTAILRCQRNTGEVYRHALAVSALMVSLGRAMRLPREQVIQAGLVGMMMDVGVGQMDAMLEGVEGDYRALPQQFLDQHIFYGHDILAATKGVASDCIQACLDHHERLDGSGYPNGQAGEAIGVLARMAAICDEFDYLVSGGFNAPPVDPHVAITALMDRAQELDADILQAFFKSIGLYPIGTFVELRSGRLAMVVDLNTDDANQPIVRTFGSWQSTSKVRQTTIDLGNCFGADAITGVATPVSINDDEAQDLRERLLIAAYR